MDKTLADYINRTLQKLQEQKAPLTENSQYLVYPEDTGTDSKQNPYSQV